MAGDASDRDFLKRAVDPRPGESHTPSPPSTPCLSAEQCLSFLQGSLRERQDADSVHRHLDKCSVCRTTMAEAVRGTIEPAPARERPLFRMLADGERVADRYEIRRFVARGGMGEVYEALDTALGERVALKTLAITTADQAEAAEGLLREVRIARKVVHHNVCRILELGLHGQEGAAAGRIPFLTMDFLEGETLKQRIQRRGALPQVEVRQITEGLTAGLAAVHAAGIVHRDFKSENVFLVRTPEGTERPLVMDFGLARAFEGSSTGASAGRHLVGTASHIAPEQLTGQVVTAAADVFALGIVVFEMLTGRLPFSGDSFAALAFSRLQQTPPAPSSLVPGLDPRWDGVIARCLERDPRKRFSRMADLVNALDGTDPFKAPSGRRAGTRRVLVAGLAALALAAIGLSGWRARTAAQSKVSGVAKRASEETARPPATAREPGNETVAVPPKPPPPASEKRENRVGTALRPEGDPQTSKRGPRRTKPTRAAPPTAGAFGGEAATTVRDDPLAPPPPRPHHPDDLADPF